MTSDGATVPSLNLLLGDLDIPGEYRRRIDAA